MKKKYPFILLSILLTLSILLPVNTYASAIEANYVSDFSGDVQLCDGAPAAVTLLKYYIDTREITGTGQPGANVTVYVYTYADATWRTYTTTVGDNGIWSVISDVDVQLNDETMAIQVDANGIETSAECIWVQG